MDIETAERLTSLEESVKKNRDDVKEIKTLFKEHMEKEERLIQDLHDEVLSNNVARKTMLKGAGVLTMLGGFFMGLWKFITELGGTH